MFSPLKSKPELGDTGPTQLIGFLQTRCWTPGTSLRDFYFQRHSLSDAYVLNQDARVPALEPDRLAANEGSALWCCTSSTAALRAPHLLLTGHRRTLDIQLWYQKSKDSFVYRTRGSELRRFRVLLQWLNSWTWPRDSCQRHRRFPASKVSVYLCQSIFIVYPAGPMQTV